MNKATKETSVVAIDVFLFFPAPPPPGIFGWSNTLFLALSLKGRLAIGGRLFDRLKMLFIFIGF